MNAEVAELTPAAHLSRETGYRTVLALTQEDLEACARLRFEVYCLDRGFLDPGAYPDGCERDADDQRSLSVLARHRDGHPAGSIRLVRSCQPGDLPFERHAAGRLSTAGVPVAEAGEVSRMVVQRNFRGRGGHGAEPLLLLELYRGLYRASLQHAIRWWYAAMEPAHVRALASFGFVFRQVGPLFDYYGLVAPCQADLRELEREMASRQPGLFDWFKDGAQ